MEGELLNPLVPVALVELGAVCGVSEQARPLTHLRAQGLIECPEAAGSKLLPGARVPVVDSGVAAGVKLAEHSGPVLRGSADSGHTQASTHLLAPPGLISEAVA